jgi:hypothetical protein
MDRSEVCVAHVARSEKIETPRPHEIPVRLTNKPDGLGAPLLVEQAAGGPNHDDLDGVLTRPIMSSGRPLSEP